MPRSPSILISVSFTSAFAPAVVNSFDVGSASSALSSFMITESGLPTNFSTDLETLGMKYDEPLASLLKLSSENTSPFFPSKTGENISSNTAINDIAKTTPKLNVFLFLTNMLRLLLYKHRFCIVFLAAKDADICYEFTDNPYCKSCDN